MNPLPYVCGQVIVFGVLVLIAGCFGAGISGALCGAVALAWFLLARAYPSLSTR